MHGQRSAYQEGLLFYPWIPAVLLFPHSMQPVFRRKRVVSSVAAGIHQERIDLYLYFRFWQPHTVIRHALSMKSQIHEWDIVQIFSIFFLAFH